MSIDDLEADSESGEEFDGFAEVDINSDHELDDDSYQEGVSDIKNWVKGDVESQVLNFTGMVQDWGYQ